jgi:hypothetical protein
MFISRTLEPWLDTSKSGGRNPLLEAAAGIDVFAGTQDDPRERELAAMRGEKVADNWEDDPRLARVAADPAAGVEASNPPASFEAIVSMMGEGPGAIWPMPEANGSSNGQG